MSDVFVALNKIGIVLQLLCYIQIIKVRFDNPKVCIITSFNLTNKCLFKAKVKSFCEQLFDNYKLDTCLVFTTRWSSRVITLK